jgi:hypothetical protein
MLTFRNILSSRYFVRYFVPTRLWKWNRQTLCRVGTSYYSPTKINRQTLSSRYFVPTRLWRWKRQTLCRVGTSYYSPMKMNRQTHCRVGTSYLLRTTRLYLLVYEDGTECSETLAFRLQPRRKHTTFKTRRKFEIKKINSTVALLNVTYSLKVPTRQENGTHTVLRNVGI